MSATMLHANALRHTYGCAREHGLKVDANMNTGRGKLSSALCHWCTSSEKATDLLMKGLFDCLQLCEFREASCCKTMIGIVQRQIRVCRPRRAASSGAMQPDPRLLQASSWLESSYDWMTVSLAMQVRTRFAAAAAKRVLWYIVAISSKRKQ